MGLPNVTEWLPALLGVLRLQSSGVELAIKRQTVNFIGGTVVDNPAQDRIDITLAPGPAGATGPTGPTGVGWGSVRKTNLTLINANDGDRISSSGAPDNVTVNLPSSPVTGAMVRVTDTDGAVPGNGIQVVATGGKTVRGADFYNFTAPYESSIFTYNGIAWEVA